MMKKIMTYVDDSLKISHRPFIYYVVVNFLSQVIFAFVLFQLYYHTLPHPKTKEKQKLPEIKN